MFWAKEHKKYLRENLQNLGFIFKNIDWTFFFPQVSCDSNVSFYEYFNVVNKIIVYYCYFYSIRLKYDLSILKVLQ